MANGSHTFPHPASRCKERSRIFLQRRCIFEVEEPDNQDNGYHYEPVVSQRLHDINAAIRNLCTDRCHVEMAIGPRGLTFKYKERDNECERLLFHCSIISRRYIESAIVSRNNAVQLLDSAVVKCLGTERSRSIEASNYRGLGEVVHVQVAVRQLLCG